MVSSIFPSTQAQLKICLLETGHDMNIRQKQPRFLKNDNLRRPFTTYHRK